MTKRPKSTSVQHSLRLRRVGNKDTKTELTVRRMVHSLGYRYRTHGAKLPGTPDLVFSRKRKIIFVHGCFWHRHECRAGRIEPRVNTSYWFPKLKRNKERDTDNQSRLRDLGWDVFVVWECDLKDREAIQDKICQFLGTPRI